VHSQRFDSDYDQHDPESANCVRLFLKLVVHCIPTIWSLLLLFSTFLWFLPSHPFRHDGKKSDIEAPNCVDFLFFKNIAA